MDESPTRFEDATEAPAPSPSAGQRANGSLASLEDALSKSESDADNALKSAASLVTALRRLRGAARQGQLRELRTAIEAARRTIQTLDQDVANSADGWDFDEDAYF